MAHGDPERDGLRATVEVKHWHRQATPLRPLPLYRGALNINVFNRLAQRFARVNLFINSIVQICVLVHLNREIY